MDPLFFTPIPHDTVWGGTAIKDYYGYEWPSDQVGQAWAFADQPDGSTAVSDGPYQGATLGELWKEHPEWFGDTDRPFPLIVSMLCPEQDLSIQVHPTDSVARAKGFPYGKNEAWYFLEAQPGSSIVFGHNAADERDMRHRIESGQWNELLRRLCVRKDDFVYVPAGTLHACGKNVIVYEVQQATNVTYRFYDYDRTDAQGNRRPLKLEEALESVEYGPDLNTSRHTDAVEAKDGWERTCYIDCPSFKIEKLAVDEGSFTLCEDAYELVSVVRGSGQVNGRPVKVGDHFLVPKGCAATFTGQLTCMMTTA